MDSSGQVQVPSFGLRTSCLLQLTNDFVSQGNTPAASQNEPQVYQQLTGALAGNATTQSNSHSVSAKQSAR